MTHLFEIELQKEIDYEMELYVCGSDPNEQTLKVSNINFTFNNKEVINLLKERAFCINNNKMDKLRKVD